MVKFFKEIDIPSEEEKKLFPFVSASLIPPILLTILVLGILFFEVNTRVQTNPVIFYAVPFIYLLMLLPKMTSAILLRTLGLRLITLRAWIVAIISIPIAWLIGWSLVKFATSGLFIFFRVATYPWVVTTSIVASTQVLATFSPATNFVLYFFVAFFEEATSVILGKNFANWFHKKLNINPVVLTIIGYLIARIVLVSHHIFSYDFGANPSLYVSAFILFAIFTIMGLFFGILASGLKIGDEFDELGYLPILIVPMIVCHMAFDYILSGLSGLIIIPTNIIMSLLPSLTSII